MPPLHPDDLPPVRRSPTGRVPEWARDEAAGRPVANTPFRSWTPSPGAVRRSRRRGFLLAAGVLLVAVSAAVGLTFVEPAQPPVSSVGPTTGQGSLSSSPTPGRGSQGAPLGVPEPLSATSDSWVPLHVDEAGTPVRWDPCRPVHYVVNPDGMPAGGDAVLGAALDRVSRATGLQFVDDGSTDETERTTPFDPDRYGDRWSPVLVSWNLPTEPETTEPGTTEPETTEPETAGNGVEGDVLGRGGPFAVGGPVPSALVSGTVGVTADAVDALGTGPELRAVWLHEWAHLVGLDHVDDPTQLMNPTVSGRVDFGAGDLTGLAALGTGECIPGV